MLLAGGFGSTVSRVTDFAVTTLESPGQSIVLDQLCLPLHGLVSARLWWLGFSNFEAFCTHANTHSALSSSPRHTFLKSLYDRTYFLAYVEAFHFVISYQFVHGASLSQLHTYASKWGGTGPVVRLNLWYLAGVWSLGCWELGKLDDIFWRLALGCQGSCI